MARRWASRPHHTENGMHPRDVQSLIFHLLSKTVAKRSKMAGDPGPISPRKGRSQRQDSLGQLKVAGFHPMTTTTKEECGDQLVN